jgi:hypothetical protein
VNILHLTNNSGQPDYKVEVNAFATCLGESPTTRTLVVSELPYQALWPD